MQSGEAERDAAQSIATKRMRRFRLGYGHAPRSKGLNGWNSSPRTETLSWRRENFDHALSPSCSAVQRPVCSRHRSTASCLATATMAFLRCAPVAPAPFGQHRQTFLYRWILWLEAHHSPGALHQCRAHSRITVLGHAAWHPFLTTGIFARTKSGVATDRAPVLKALPVADLPADHDRRQFAHPLRDLRRRGDFQFRVSAAICWSSASKIGR